VGALDVSGAGSPYFETAGRMVRKIRPLFNRVIIGGASLTADEAESEIDSGMVDCVTWGRAFIANPDLADKLKAKVELVPFADPMRATLV
jgi:N-ethylmaleimide reductase